MSQSWGDLVEQWADHWKSTAELVIYQTHPTARGAAEAQQNDLPNQLHARIMDFATPEHPNAIQTLTGYLHKAEAAVQENSSVAYQRTASLLEDWQGDAAEGFKDFLYQMDDATREHHDLLHALAAVVQGFDALVDAMQTHLQEILDRGAKGLDEAGQAEKKILLTTTSALKDTVISAAGGDPLGVANAVTNGLINAEIMSTGAESKPEALLSLESTLTEFSSDMSDKMAHVGKGFEQVGDEIKKDMPTIDPKQPSLVKDDSFNPRDFTLQDQQFQQDTNDVSHRDLAEETWLGPGQSKHPHVPDKPKPPPFPDPLGLS